MTTSAEDRTLILLRHAEAEAGRAGQDDRERCLTDHGREEAQSIGRWLRDQGLGCDEVLCSPAQRTRETMIELAEAGCAEAEIEIEHRLYNADVDDILAVVREATEDASVVLVIGHAPGLPAAASLLAEGEGSDQAHEHLAEGYPPRGGGRAALLRSLERPRLRGGHPRPVPRPGVLRLSRPSAGRRVTCVILPIDRR